MAVQVSQSIKHSATHISNRHRLGSNACISHQFSHRDASAYVTAVLARTSRPHWSKLRIQCAMRQHKGLHCLLCLLTRVLFTRCNIVPILLHNLRVMNQCFRLPRIMGFVTVFPTDQELCQVFTLARAMIHDPINCPNQPPTSEHSRWRWLPSAQGCNSDTWNTGCIFSSSGRFNR